MSTDDPRAALAAAIRTMIGELTGYRPDDASSARAVELVDEAVALLAAGRAGQTRRSIHTFDGGGSPGSSFAEYSSLSGTYNPLSPPMVLRQCTAVVHEGDEPRDVFEADVTFGSAYEGPPGCVHGGFVAAIFDELLGFVQALTGNPGMTGRLNVGYRTPTPLMTPLRMVGWVERVEGRRIYARATLHVLDREGRVERLCADAEGLFVSMTPEVRERLFGSLGTPSAHESAG